MKKTIQIHIGGRQFHINEDAYQKIKTYTESLKLHFADEGASTVQEIIEDIEIRIAELFEERIGDAKQAITLEDVDEIIDTLGKAEDFDLGESQPAEEEFEEEADYDRRDYRRLFRDPDNYYFGGVASGLAAYFDIDPVWMRIIFVILLFLNGLGFIIYVVLWIAIPKARTTAEKLLMRGIPVNLSNIRNSIDAEFKKVRRGVSNFGRSHGVSRIGDMIEKIARALGQVFIALLKVMAGIIGAAFVVAGTFLIILFLLLLFGQVDIFSHFHVWNGLNFQDMTRMFAGIAQYNLMIISLMIVLIIPVTALIYEGIKLLFNIQTKHRLLRAFTVTAWILALVLFATLVFVNISNFAVEASDTEYETIENTIQRPLYIDIRDNTAGVPVTNYRVFEYEFKYNNRDETLYRQPTLRIGSTNRDEPSLVIDRKAHNIGVKNAQDYLEKIRYNWGHQDSALMLDMYFNTNDEDFWMFATMDINLYIPEGQVIVISESVCDLLSDIYRYRYCYDSAFVDKPVVMTSEGLRSAVIKSR